MERRTFLAMVSGSLLAAPLAAGAQQAGKVYRIGLLSTMSPGGDPRSAYAWEGLLQGLRELGYVEGGNLHIERRYAPEGKAAELPELAADLVRVKVDVIVAGGSLTPHAAKRRAKVTRGYLAQLGAGHKTNPSLPTLRRLAKALGVPVAELLG